MSAMSREEIEEFRRHREWWKRPDPYDPQNAPDESEDGSPVPADQGAGQPSEASTVAPATDDHNNTDPTPLTTEEEGA